MRLARWSGLLALVVLLVGCTGAGASTPTPTKPPLPTATSDPGAGEFVEINEFTGLLWGSGDYGVVLVGASSGAAAAWREPALALAAEDMTVLALNDYSYSYVVDAIDYLRSERNVDAVALIGVSTGAPPVIGAGIIAPDKVDQIILISGFGEYQDMGNFPKLFVVGESEAGMLRRARTMAADAPGENNELLVLPGSASAEALFTSVESSAALMTAIIDRLKQFR